MGEVNPWPPGSKVRCTDMVSAFYGRTGTVTKLGDTGGWYVLWDGETEPSYAPWGVDSIRPSMTAPDPAEAERAAVVAWLRECAARDYFSGVLLTDGDRAELRRGWLDPDPEPELCGDDPWEAAFRAAARAIEAGEHRKEHRDG